MVNGKEQMEIPKGGEAKGIPGGMPGKCGIIPAAASTKCETIIKIRGSKICQDCQYRYRYK